MRRVCSCGGWKGDGLSVTTCAREDCHRCFNHCTCAVGFISPSDMIDLKLAKMGVERDFA